MLSNNSSCTAVTIIPDKIYQEMESNSNNAQDGIMDDNYANTLSFSSALCELYDSGFGSSNNIVCQPDASTSNLVENTELSQSPCIKSYIELRSKHIEDDSPNEGTTSTPRKPPKPVNTDLSPDLFSEDEAPSLIGLQKNTEEMHVAKEDRFLQRRLQESLCGVFPPPSVTIVQLTVDEMLQKINENKNLLITDFSDFENINATGSCEKKNSLLINCNKQDFISEQWPRVMHHRYHGLHYNISRIHEDIECMCAKYVERYIGAETQSSCTVFGIGTYNSSPSKRKPKFKRFLKSPGKRLSHLARRRITFSKDSLQASSSNNSLFGSRTRQIMIDARKFEMLSRRRSPMKKKSPFKLPRKSPRKKFSGSAQKRYALRSKMLDEDEACDTSAVLSSGPNSGNTKRALFQKSPDKGKSTTGLLRLLGADTSETKSSKRRTPRRALFPSPIKPSPTKPGVFTSKRRSTPRCCLFSPDSSNSSQGELFDRKRKRIESESEPALKLQKNVITSATYSENITKRKFNGSETVHVLAEHRKKKLMWAVAEALRSQNVDLKHPQFKPYASVLARLIRYFLPNLFGNGPRPEGSTTENMLRIARQYAFAVTRGKTLNEIIVDFKCTQSKPNKPSGYVGLDKVLTESAQSRNKDNILQESEKGFDVDNPKSGRKENIERIRRVIDFDELGSSSTKR